MKYAPIVIFAFNRLDVLQDCVNSLINNTEAKNSDLYVFVDGARASKEGYSHLGYNLKATDMQAAGLPIITTNVRAQPELNPHGWMVNLPLNYAGEVGLQNRNQKEEVRRIFISQLVEIFNQILDKKDEIVNRSELSYNHIIRNHSLIDYSKKIELIYNSMYD